MWASKEDREELRAREREGCWSGVYTIRAASRRGPSFTSDKTKDGIESLRGSPLLSSLFVERVAAAANHPPWNDDREAEVEIATCRLRFRKCSDQIELKTSNQSFSDPDRNVVAERTPTRTFIGVAENNDREAPSRALSLFLRAGVFTSERYDAPREKEHDLREGHNQLTSSYGVLGLAN
ncbi:hypothetical protein ALC57_03237 [Trachymyrmex cornetzi]|uniref:Uncharacterized protein n=1 Tax=Trachymyrmex cornetzi TaxID=471704 RepID=A0A151JM41_9HYME|nr:hypothetical protein ALC57_03237 [Trachymyrmex cornetzi]